MLVSYNWLKEFLPDLAVSPEEVARLLTTHAVETLVSRTISIDASIRVVKIVRIQPHPNADRLRLATITDGKEEIRVVCGAPNIQEGDIVPYAPVGEKTIRGVKSPGMLSSPMELGLGSDHGGILILEKGLELGVSLKSLIPDDAILELEVTPNRAHDLLSVRGVARELAAILDIDFHDVVAQKLEGARAEVDGFTVSVADPNDTPRYMGIVLNGLHNGVSPVWMQTRLFAIGSRPVNAIVDITNYVMFEMGNPSHAFDSSRLSGKHIGVRRARNEESVSLLDGSEKKLTPDVPIITVEDAPVAVAGVMGGVGTEVGESTKDIFLEVANFRAYLIQETARGVATHTEASRRFSKGISPQLTHETAERLVHLYTELCGAEIMGYLDIHPDETKKRVVSFNPAQVEGFSGNDIDIQETRRVLERLRFEVEVEDKIWNVAVPHDRLDVAISADVAEEVIRLHGLDSIQVSEYKSKSQGTMYPRAYWREGVKDILVEQGFTETYNDSFAEEGDIEVANPVDGDKRYMRVHLLDGLVGNLKTNRDDVHRKFKNQERALFEIGKVFRKGDSGTVPGIIEEEHIAGVVVGEGIDARRVVREIVDRMESVLPAGDNIVQSLSPDVLKKLKYQLPVQVFEISLDDLIRHAKEISPAFKTLEELRKETAYPAMQYQPYSRHPSVYQDISVLVSSDISSEQVREVIERVGGDLVADTDLFDEFIPEGEDTKGLAFHIEYQAQDRTLRDDEVSKVHQRIESALIQEFSADIR